MTLKTLRHLSTTLHETDAAEDEKSIDYSSVGLYLSGLQLVFTVVCCACASVLSCWLIPSHSGSAVRTLVITSTVAMVLVRKPLRIGRVRGVNTLFNALRPCVVVYIVALVIEQLIHTCVSIDAAAALDDNNLLKSLVYHATSGLLVVGGFIRATSPRKETDWPFLLSTSCLLLLAIYPPQALVHSGPLCAPTTLLGAGERVLRSLLFSCLYVVLVYSAAPSRNVSNELFICVGRATAASVWVLAVTPWVLPLAPLQVAIALFARLRDTSDTGHEATDTSESLPLRAPGAMTPNNGLEPSDADVDISTDSVGVYHGDAPDPEALKLAIAAANASRLKNSISPLNGNGCCGCNHSANTGISFNFSRQQQPSNITVAQIAARECATELTTV